MLSVEAINEKMNQKFGYSEYEDGTKALFPHIHSMSSLMPLINKHPNWNFKCINYGGWEVRTGVGHDDAYYHKSLPVAICLALLDLKI